MVFDFLLTNFFLTKLWGAMMRSIAMGVLAAHELDDHGPMPLVHILSLWLHPSQICAYPLHIHLASIRNKIKRNAVSIYFTTVHFRYIRSVL